MRIRLHPNVCQQIFTFMMVVAIHLALIWILHLGMIHKPLAKTQNPITVAIITEAAAPVSPKLAAMENPSIKKNPSVRVQTAKVAPKPKTITKAIDKVILDSTTKSTLVMPLATFPERQAHDGDKTTPTTIPTIAKRERVYGQVPAENYCQGSFTLDYPTNALKDNIEGTVKLRFRVDATGKFSEALHTDFGAIPRSYRGEFRQAIMKTFRRYHCAHHLEQAILQKTFIFKITQR